MPTTMTDTKVNMTFNHNQHKRHMDVSSTLRTLIVDNYDSYTFNLLQLFDEEQLKNVVVVRNDQFEWPQFEQEVLPYFDQIILSPGPGRPERPQDFGICTQILQTTHIPIFGICLGHQGIGHIHGAKVTYGPEPVHGQIAAIHHDGTGLFAGIPQDFEAVRYHSLVIQEDSLPSDLISTAFCISHPLIQGHRGDSKLEKDISTTNGDDSCGDASSSTLSTEAKSIMGIRHATLPHHGVQFHPESICTKHGKQMMNNFFKISQEFYSNQNRPESLDIPDYVRAYSVVPTMNTSDSAASSKKLKRKHEGYISNPYSLIIQALDPSLFPDPEMVFSSLFLTGPESPAASWWLDSARQPHPMSRFSFMGGVETRRHRHGEPQHQTVVGAVQAVVQYSTLHKEVTVRHYSKSSNNTLEKSHIRRFNLDAVDGEKGSTASTFWDWMSDIMSAFSRENVEATVLGPAGEIKSFDDVPFDFFAGMVGYFGYEMKRESLEGYHTPLEQQCSCSGHAGEAHVECTCECRRRPDASFVLATQAVAFDHVKKQVYVLGVVNNTPKAQQEGIEGSLGFESQAACENWIQDVTSSLRSIASCNPPPSSTTIGSRRRSVISTSQSTTSEHSTPYLLKQRHRRLSSAGLVSPFKVDVTEKDYLQAIRDSLDYIHEGESYELCLTAQFRAKVPQYPSKDPQQSDPAFDLYKILRKLNSAPFSAFLSMPTARNPVKGVTGDETVDKLIILSSSPERFLKIGQRPSDEVKEDGDEMDESCTRTVEMKPIKGTVAVAKGCFCKEDEGCGVDERDDDSSEHAHDDEESDSNSNLNSNSNSTSTNSTPREVSSRRLRSDRCAEARQREDQRRVDSLSKNIKERAENLMIVDLIRNDLAHVCSSSSVRVPYLMHVESYETVHQLVTTVRGELFDHVDNTQAVRACFPPGSMTGAPKLRSVQLLDSLEHHVPRGVYSGCLGYIGISATSSKSSRPIKKIRTAVDMSVVIRTAVLSVPSVKNASGQSEPVVADVSVGAGGALTILSDANEEWREVQLKSRSVVPSRQGVSATTVNQKEEQRVPSGFKASIFGSRRCEDDVPDKTHSASDLSGSDIDHVDSEDEFEISRSHQDENCRRRRRRRRRRRLSASASHLLASAPAVPDLRFDHNFRKALDQIYVAHANDLVKAEASLASVSTAGQKKRAVSVPSVRARILVMTLRDIIIMPFVHGFFWGFGTILVTLAGQRSLAYHLTRSFRRLFGRDDASAPTPIFRGEPARIRRPGTGPASVGLSGGRPGFAY
ncbi:Protein phosphatase PP2A regulatory subunit B [Podila epigama]|nr:Protein phosphatase PP2A regulatory subunit B [Podila epigama]